MKSSVMFFGKFSCPDSSSEAPFKVHFLLRRRRFFCKETETHHPGNRQHSDILCRIREARSFKILECNKKNSLKAIIEEGQEQLGNRRDGKKPESFHHYIGVYCVRRRQSVSLLCTCFVVCVMIFFSFLLGELYREYVAAIIKRLLVFI